MLEHIGLLGGVVVLMVLALRGVNIIFSSLLCALVVVVTNQLPLAQSFSDYYAFGPLGAFSFAGKFFLLFVSGAIFGRVMAASNAATSIALSLARAFGAHRMLWIVTLSCAMLTYGGVVVFIVIFTLYPLGLKLLQEANIPKRLFCAAIALGGGTFTLSALPGTPSVQNVISSVALGTDLFAGAGIGLLAAVIMFAGGIWYLERERLKAEAAGEGFVPSVTDKVPEPGENTADYPHWALAVLPLVLVLLLIVVPRLITATVGDVQESMSPDAVSGLYQLLQFTQEQLILWPSIALLSGSLVAVLMCPRLRKTPLVALGAGAEDAIMPLLNTSAVIGFGGVVVHTAGFQQFTSLVLQADLPPLLSMFGSVSLTSAVVGSASGGLQIFMETMAPQYLAMGIPPQTLHRLATIASGGFDSLPHCGAIVAMLTITGLTHREAYKDLAVVTVVIPVGAALAAMTVSALL